MTTTDHSDDEIMCDCTGTTRAEIETLFFEGRDLNGISRKTGVLTGCGGCEWDIQDHLDTLTAMKKKSE